MEGAQLGNVKSREMSASVLYSTLLYSILLYSTLLYIECASPLHQLCSLAEAESHAASFWGGGSILYVNIVVQEPASAVTLRNWKHL